VQVSQFNNVGRSRTSMPPISPAHMQKDAKPITTPSCRPLARLGPSEQQPPVQRPDGVQTLLEQTRPPWWHAQQQLQTQQSCLTQQRQDDSKHDAAFLLPRELTTPNPVQHHSGVASILLPRERTAPTPAQHHSGFSNSLPREPKIIPLGGLHKPYPGIWHGVSQRVALQQHCTRKQSLYGRNLAKQPACTLQQPSSCQGKHPCL